MSICGFICIFSMMVWGSLSARPADEGTVSAAPSWETQQRYAETFSAVDLLLADLEGLPLERWAVQYAVMLYMVCSQTRAMDEVQRCTLADCLREAGKRRLCAEQADTMCLSAQATAEQISLVARVTCIVEQMSEGADCFELQDVADALRVVLQEGVVDHQISFHKQNGKIGVVLKERPALSAGERACRMRTEQAETFWREIQSSGWLLGLSAACVAVGMLVFRTR